MLARAFFTLLSVDAIPIVVAAISTPNNAMLRPLDDLFDALSDSSLSMSIIATSLFSVVVVACASAVELLVAPASIVVVVGVSCFGVSGATRVVVVILGAVDVDLGKVVVVTSLVGGGVDGASVVEVVVAGAVVEVVVVVVVVVV